MEGCVVFKMEEEESGPATPAVVKPPPRRHVLTLAEKERLISDIEAAKAASPLTGKRRETNVAIAKRLGMPASTLNTILSKKDIIRKDLERFGQYYRIRKTRKDSPYVLVEQELLRWMKENKDSIPNKAGNMLREKAMEIATRLGITSFSASNGWFFRFKTRHNLYVKPKRKKGDASTSATDDSPGGADSFNYSLDDVKFIIVGEGDDAAAGTSEPMDVSVAGEISDAVIEYLDATDEMASVTVDVDYADDDIAGYPSEEEGETKSRLKALLLRGLHLMPTPPAVEVHYEAATAAQNGDLKPPAADSDRWPPIPATLASEARHSVEGNITARRRSVGGETSGPIRLLVQPVELKKANKDTLYKIFATEDSVPKSIYINKPVDPSKRCTWATLEYDDLREAEGVIRKHHLKSPHYWQIRVEQPEAVELPEQVEEVQFAGSPAGDSAPEQRPPSVLILDERACGDQLHAPAYGRADVCNVSGSEYAALLQIAEQQRLQLQQLSSEVAALCKAVEDKPPRHKTLLAQIGKLLTKQSSETSLQFQEWQATRGEQDRKKQEDAFLGAISQLVTAAVTTQVPGMVREHVQATLQPQLCQAILQVVEPMQNKLHLDMTKQVASLDQHISKQISQLLNSKVISENLSQSAVAAMKPASQACFTEVYTQTIMPRFEKACTQMFRQVNETFAKGTLEIVSQLKEAVKLQQHQQQDKSGQLLAQLQTLTQTVEADTEQLKQQVATSVGAEVAAQLHRSLAGVQDGLTKCVRDNMARGFQRQQATIQSKVMEGLRSITPAPSVVVDTHTRILQLVAQEDVNAAFQMALSAADLTLVVLVCEKVDPDTLFSQSPCPLQQNVILSLIQQLSADMDNHTDTKHKYLLEAVMNLDVRNPDTRAHIPAVIARLQQQLSAYIANSANPKMTSKVKQLLFSTRALLNT